MVEMKKRRKVPNFLLVGAAKCGTTSLHHYLCQHPAIFMPKWKELSFFCSDPNAPPLRVKNLHDYHRLFSDIRNEDAIGEASTCYLYDAFSPNLIKTALGQIKIIIILRNPVDMAYSLYNQQLRKEGETIDTFERALIEETNRFNSDPFKKKCYGWHANYYYFRRGLFHGQVKRYLDTFGNSKVKVLLFDDLVKNPVAISQQIYRFLEVDDTFLPTVKIFNKGGTKFDIPSFWKDIGLLRKTVSFALSKNLIRKMKLLVQKRNMPSPRPIRIDTAQSLSKRFEPDIVLLEYLLKLDLSSWKMAYF